MLLNEIVSLSLDDDEDTSPAAAAAARARIRAAARAQARADAMRHGAGIKLTPAQVKAIGARKHNEQNAPRASNRDEIVADEVMEMVRQAYTNVRVYKNYNIGSIAIKVGGATISDKVSNPVRKLNDTLRDEYGIEPVELGRSTVIYHIPYSN